MEPQQTNTQPQPDIQIIPGQAPQIGNPTQKSSPRQKIILFVILGIVGLVVLLLLITLLADGGNQSSKYLGKVIARNEEMLRVLDEYGKESRSKDVSIQIASSQLILFSDTKALKDAGFGSTAKQIEQVTISNLDSKIGDSIAQGRFDDFIKDYLTNAFEQNIADIDLALPEVKSDNTKNLLLMMRQNYEDLK